MRTQFYAIGLDDEQRPEFNGLMARQHGRKSDMQGFIGQYVGTNSRFYSNGDYEIGVFSRESFVDDMGTRVLGAIYSIAES